MSFEDYLNHRFDFRYFLLDDKLLESNDLQTQRLCKLNGIELIYEVDYLEQFYRYVNENTHVYSLHINDLPITNLGRIKYVGHLLYLYNNKTLKTLGNTIKAVGNQLSLSDSDVECLGSLSMVGQTLFVENCKLNNIGDLEYIGYYHTKKFYLGIRGDSDSRVEKMYLENRKRLIKNLVD